MGVRARDVVGAAAGFAAGVAVGVGVAWAAPAGGGRTALTGYDVDLAGPIRVTKTTPPVSEAVYQPYFIARGLEDRVRLGDSPPPEAGTHYTVTFAGTKQPVAVLCELVRSAP